MNNISVDTSISNNYRNQRDKDNDTGKKVVAGGGAVAATSTAMRARAARSGFDMFNSSSKVARGMKGFTETTKTVNGVAKQTRGLWGKVVENSRWAKSAIIKWGNNLKTGCLKPLLKSKLFKGCAGALGYGFGFVTLISGLSDIGKVTTEAIENRMLNKN